MLIQCPACRARTKLSDEKEGSKVRCSECGRVHVARAAPPRVASRLDRGLWIAAAVVLVGLVFLALRRFSETDGVEARAADSVEAPAEESMPAADDPRASDPVEPGDELEER